ncbi:acyl-CoA carboxylase subunit epsilon [Dactylosporangium sp. NBC_01737]|uniref:acyl-CoA carboxylase subunit epsilon n=1 Tax=Dactylosporangium sp. NBC_01737 TaxID=2975959 RepID=UPI002E124A4F|nr:acyl-CoA carboxylase subunit epsilon [Dactylosporangium sp. NBC_01737]
MLAGRQRFAHFQGVTVAEEALFKVVRGTPTAEEVAAIVGVLFSRPAAAAAPAPAPVSRWRQSARPGSRPRWK